MFLTISEQIKINKNKMLLNSIIRTTQKIEVIAGNYKQFLFFMNETGLWIDSETNDEFKTQEVAELLNLHNGQYFWNY